ncbi:LysR substrate-binding domain-containing protein [Jhaorihella thermophila]
MRDHVFPVCAPQIAARLRSPDDLSRETCLTDSTWTYDWALWAGAVMPGAGFCPRGPVHSLYSLAVEETVNGAGVLMGREALVAPLLQSGALVAPFFEKKVPLPQPLTLWSLRSLRPGTPVARVVECLRTGA